jgi:hypothetical protein
MAPLGHYWPNPKILFCACVEEGYSAPLKIAREKQTNSFHLRWS